MEPPVTAAEEPVNELETLCREASEVPSLWHHPAVTNQERKEILRCIVDHIVVTATKQRIDAKIFWKTGDPTPISILRSAGRDELIRELHAQKLTVLEIREHLAAGKTSTGEIANITRDGLYNVMRKLRLKAHRSSYYRFLRQKADELNRAGRSLEWIAQHFNQQHLKSAWGKMWTPVMVKELLRGPRDQATLLNNIHRNAILEALARGLSFQEIAHEFNERKLRRRSGSHSWTARSVRQRWNDLKRRQCSREQKDETRQDVSESVVLKKSA